MQATGSEVAASRIGSANCCQTPHARHQRRFLRERCVDVKSHDRHAESGTGTGTESGLRMLRRHRLWRIRKNLRGYSHWI